MKLNNPERLRLPQIVLQPGFPLVPFEKIYGLFHDPLFNHALRLTGRWHTAEDITEEAFTRAYPVFTKPKQPINVGHYLYRTATNLRIDQARREHLIDWKNIDDHPFSVTSDSAEKEATRRETVEEINKGLASLPPRYKEVLILIGNDFSAKAAAEHMGVTVSSIKAMLYKARIILRNQLPSHSPIS